MVPGNALRGPHGGQAGFLIWTRSQLRKGLPISTVSRVPHVRDPDFAHLYLLPHLRQCIHGARDSIRPTPTLDRRPRPNGRALMTRVRVMLRSRRQRDFKYCPTGVDDGRTNAKTLQRSKISWPVFCPHCVRPAAPVPARAATLHPIDAGALEIEGPFRLLLRLLENPSGSPKSCYIAVAGVPSCQNAHRILVTARTQRLR